MVPINKFGMVKTADAEKTNLPIFNFLETENPFDEKDYSCVDLCTAAQLKLLDIYLTDSEKQNIKGFVKMKGYRGLAPVYSLREMLNNRA